MNKYYMSSYSRFSERQKDYLRTLGFTHFYELRDQERNSYSIEKHVFVNNIGCIATNFAIAEDWCDDDMFFTKYNPIESVREVDAEELDKYRL